MRTGDRAALAAAVFGLLPACGVESIVPLESAAACGPGWQTIMTAPSDVLTSPLLYRDGLLYYSLHSSQTLTALPTSGGAASTVASGYASNLWIDGDQIVYAAGEQGIQFYTVPTAGGSPTLLLDGATGRSTTGKARFYDFDGTNLVWAEDDGAGDGPTTVWRGTRAGGGAVQIGSLAGDDPGAVIQDSPFLKIALAGDSVLLAASKGLAYAVPLDGGAPRPLAATDDLVRRYGWLAGLDATGAYWNVPRANAPLEDGAESVDLAPADGSPVRLFWQGTPVQAAVVGMWPTGDDGWVLAVQQTFDDHRAHLAIWLLDADGTGRRLACSPLDGLGIPNIFVRPAVTPDAVYFIMYYNQIEIVRVPR